MSGQTRGSAVKCFVADLVRSGRLSPRNSEEPQRVWVQGVAVAGGLGGTGGSAEARGFVLDDGTGLLPIDACKLPPLAPSSSSPSPSTSSAVVPCPLGAYVMVIGNTGRREDGARVVVAAKLVDLSSDPNRESMWFLEVVESSLRLA